MFSWCHWWIFTKLKRVKDSSEAYIRVCQEWTSVSGRSIMWCDGPSPNILRLGGSAICRSEHFSCTKPFLFWNISMKCETSSKWRCRLAQTILHSWSSGRFLVIGRMLQELIVIFFQVARNKKNLYVIAPQRSRDASVKVRPRPLDRHPCCHTMPLTHNLFPSPSQTQRAIFTILSSVSILIHSFSWNQMPRILSQE